MWEYYPIRNGFCRPDPKAYNQRTLYEAMSALESSLGYEHILDDLITARGSSERGCLARQSVQTVLKSVRAGMFASAVSSVPV
jgi:hypothetical protein